MKMISVTFVLLASLAARGHCNGVKGYLEDQVQHPYQFSYSTGQDGPAQSFREEQRGGNGVVTGKYGYVDPYGKLRVVNYEASPEAFYATGDIGPDMETVKIARRLEEEDRAQKAAFLAHWNEVAQRTAVAPQWSSNYGRAGKSFFESSQRPERQIYGQYGSAGAVSQAQTYGSTAGYQFDVQHGGQNQAYNQNVQQGTAQYNYGKTSAGLSNQWSNLGQQAKINPYTTKGNYAYEVEHGTIGTTGGTKGGVKVQTQKEKVYFNVPQQAVTFGDHSQRLVQGGGQSVQWSNQYTGGQGAQTGGHSAQWSSQYTGGQGAQTGGHSAQWSNQYTGGQIAQRADGVKGQGEGYSQKATWPVRTASSRLRGGGQTFVSVSQGGPRGYNYNYAF